MYTLDRGVCEKIGVLSLGGHRVSVVAARGLYSAYPFSDAPPSGISPKSSSPVRSRTVCCYETDVYTVCYD